jgi:hypothetical protein
VGVTQQAPPVRQARAHHPPLPRRHPRPIRLGLSNARLEGLNSKVRLISRRSFGFHGPDPLIALIYLCASGIVIDPPFTTNP